MKKKLVVLMICAFVLGGLAACGTSVSYDKYDLNEYIKVGKYKGLKAESYTVNVTEDDIDAKIQADLEAAVASVEVSKNDTIKDGDKVNIDYVGKKDGKAFDGGSAEGYELEIGSNSFIDGFEEGLVGKKVGDKVKLNLTFPEDYQSEDLAGQDVVFNVVINSATRNVVPEYNLDFVKKNTDYDSIKAYEDAVEKKLYDEKETEAINNQQDELWSQVMDNTEIIKYPDEIVDHYMKFNSQQIDDMAKSYGVTREEMLKNYEFRDEEEFAAINEDSSRFRVKQEMVIEYIAAKEGIEYTNEEADALVAEFEAMGYDEATIESQTGRSMDEYVRIELLYQKVLQFLVENAKIK